MKHGKSGKSGNSAKKSAILTAAMLTVALGLLGASVVGSSRAALTYFSETYGAQVSMLDIGVTLEQNDLDSDPEKASRVSWRDYVEGKDNVNEQDNWDEHTGALVQDILQQTDGKLTAGHRYDEVLRVRNTGNIDEYVRVTIYRYWEEKNADGEYKKAPQYDSDLIDLNLVNVGSAWTEDESARTEERTVLYYNSILSPGEASLPFSDWIEIEDEPVEAAVTKETSPDGIITTTYDYNDTRFVLKVDVEAVQDHNALTGNGAMISAWGTTGTWPVIDE